MSWEWVGLVGRRETLAQVVGVSLGSEWAAGSSSGAAERQQERRPSVLCGVRAVKSFVPSSLGTQATKARDAGHVYHYRKCGVSK